MKFHVLTFLVDMKISAEIDACECSRHVIVKTVSLEYLTLKITIKNINNFA